MMMLEADLPESAKLSQVFRAASELPAAERVQWWCRVAADFADREHTEGLDLALAEALRAACDELCDLRRAAEVWRELLVLAARAEAWEYLMEETLTGLAFAKMVGDKGLERAMMEARYRAMREMGFRPLV